MSDRDLARPVTVLQSFPKPRPTTNPYIVMLATSLQVLPDVRLRYFSWRTALLTRYDVVHLHWPEILVGGSSRPKRALRQLLVAVLIVRWRVQRVPVVRTVHNLELPTGLSPTQIFLLNRIANLCTLAITLNRETVTRAPSELILHGHYRDWYRSHPREPVVPGRLAFVGLVRRYKGVEQLVAAFRGMSEPNLSLHIAGQPSTPGLAERLSAAATDDSRITLRCHFLSDPELVAEITAAEMVVLPYLSMHNSGGVLAALSLDRPVLVPDNSVTRALAEEVGDGWVLTYRPPLTSAKLASALTTLRYLAALGRPGRPGLAARDWQDAGRQHLDAYRRALRLRRARPVSVSSARWRLNASAAHCPPPARDFRQRRCQRRRRR